MTPEEIRKIQPAVRIPRNSMEEFLGLMIQEIAAQQSEQARYLGEILQEIGEWRRMG